MTQSMMRWVLTGCVALAALGTVTVLDVGSSTAEASPSVSPFAGSWSGTWYVNEGEVFGTFDVTISDTGRISGRVYSTTAVPGDGKVVGHVGADGRLTLLGWAPSDTPGIGANGFPFGGTAVIDDEDKLVASLERVDGGIFLFATLERE